MSTVSHLLCDHTAICASRFRLRPAVSHKASTVGGERFSHLLLLTSTCQKARLHYDYDFEFVRDHSVCSYYIMGASSSLYTLREML